MVTDWLKALLLALPLLPLVAGSSSAHAQDDDDDSGGAETVESGKGPASPPRRGGDDPRQAAEAEQLRVGASAHVRRFHEVLDELLAEFGYDIKMGQIKGLANVSIRKITVSDAIPKSYQDYVEMLVTERIRENSQVRLIACVPCKTRTSSLVDGKLMITSPATNMAKLEAAATSLGIENFMDVVLVYHTTHMVLAASVFNAQTKEVVWARTYNSETIKSRYQKLAVDYSQVEKSRPGEDYVPEYRFMWGAGGAVLPNVDGSSSTMLAAQIRATEKFNNRRSEFGMMLALAKTTSSVFQAYPSTPTASGAPVAPPAPPPSTPKPFATALGLYGVYSHLFVGAVESYNEVRYGLNVGAGGLVATGYLAPAARIGWDVYLGRRFSVSVAGDYVGPATILVNEQPVQTKGGGGADAVLSWNY